jgi:hypothetical protein
MLPKLISLICVALIFPCAASAEDEDWKTFEARMMPYVGKTITVSGKLVEGKDSPFVLMVSRGGVNLKFRFDGALMERNVSATGVLRFRKGSAAPAPGVSGIAPMFYFDDGIVTVAR